MLLKYAAKRNIAHRNRIDSYTEQPIYPICRSSYQLKMSSTNTGSHRRLPNTPSFEFDYKTSKQLQRCLICRCCRLPDHSKPEERGDAPEANPPPYRLRCSPSKQNRRMSTNTHRKEYSSVRTQIRSFANSNRHDLQNRIQQTQYG